MANGAKIADYRPSKRREKVPELDERIRKELIVSLQLLQQAANASQSPCNFRTILQEGPYFYCTILFHPRTPPTDRDLTALKTKIYGWVPDIFLHDQDIPPPA